MSTSYYNTQPNNSIANQAGTLPPNNQLSGILPPAPIPIPKYSAIINMRYTDRALESCQTNRGQSIQPHAGGESNLSPNTYLSNQGENLTEGRSHLEAADTPPDPQSLWNSNQGPTGSVTLTHDHEPSEYPESCWTSATRDYEVEFCVLTQSVYPKTILSVSTPVAGTKPGTPPSSSTYTTSETDLVRSISSALSQLDAEPSNLNALEVIGSPRCLPPQFRKTLNTVLSKHSDSENIVYRWKASSGYQEGFREVFLKDFNAPPTQVLTLERTLALKVKVIRGSYITNCTSTFYDLWAIQDLHQRQPPNSVQCVQLVISQTPLGTCSVESAYTINEVPSRNFPIVSG